MYSIDMDTDGAGKLSQSSQAMASESGNKFTIPGILHFIQHEWARFEMERAHWEVERAELQARIAFLQGERKGQENLKHDLIRRIKMLEYALKQERAKYHRLKYGTDIGGQDKSLKEQEQANQDAQPNDVITNNGSNSKPNMNWRQGRQLLRQYLQEVGYTDTILDVRSSRVRSILGLSAPAPEVPPIQMNGTAPRTPEEGHEFEDELQVQHPKPIHIRQPIQGGHEIVNPTPVRRAPTQPPISQVGKKAAEEEIQSEADVMAEFNFLHDNNMDGEDDDDDMDDGGSADDESDEREEFCNERRLIKKPKTEHAKTAQAGSQDEWGVDQNLLAKLKQYKSEKEKEKEKKTKISQKRPPKLALQAMLANLSGEEEMIPSTSSTPAITGPSPVRLSGSRSISEIPPSIGSMSVSPKGSPIKSQGPAGSPPADEPFEKPLGLGDLADLTVINEAEPLSYEISNKEEFRKTWNPKFTLRRSNVLDVEPIYTFRGHTNAVLSVVISSTSDMCFSGGADSAIFCWNIPSLDLDPYGPYSPNVKRNLLEGHTDAVWGLAVQTNSLQLLSCSSDGTCKLWNPTLKSPLLNTFILDKETTAIPTSIDFLRMESSQMVVSYSNACCAVFDLETATPIVQLDSAKTYSTAGATQINKVVSHPTLPVTITAHEDRHIRFFDNNSGKQIHSMVAHLDSVTSLAVDPNGLYLLSGSKCNIDVNVLTLVANNVFMSLGHDCSIRLWNLDTKTCVQEITSHRKKFDESIYDVAFHPSKPYIASAGADGLAKVFV
ncbi:hypothetical protein QZH41_014041 [Actinostola sp. cb2023]|nr:hypothetical protein QZH41_014041 [Actinostola sp. cb2023]